MNFHFSEEQAMVRDLARGILTKEISVERIKALENTGEWHDDRLWSTLAEAGLLGIAAPEDAGGMGLSLLELCVLLEEIGRVVAPIAVLPTLVLGGLPVGQFATSAQKKRLLAPMVAGEAILTAALEDSEPSHDGLPAARAVRSKTGWTLNARKRLVPAAKLAQVVLVPARADGGVGVFLVDPSTHGVATSRHRTSRGEPLYDLFLDDVNVPEQDLLGERIEPDMRVVRWMTNRALAAICAMQVGVCERALELTADYVRERVQFGVPIGSFQAVQHRAADGFIDLAAMRWVTWRAVWKLDQDAAATREIAVAKFWAADAGARIAASAQHLHAGIGVDIDYPIHRYYLWSKALELGLGGAHAHLDRLGRDMAANPPRGLAEPRREAS